MTYPRPPNQQWRSQNSDAGSLASESDLLAAMISSFSRGVPCNGSDGGTVAGETAAGMEVDHRAVASSPLLPLVKPHQTHRGGGQGCRELWVPRRAAITMHLRGVLVWGPS